MSNKIGIGFSVPKMLPITGTWTLPFAAYLVLLSNRVTNLRLSNKKFLGDRSEPSSSPDEQTSPDALYLATRAHGNFIENVPLAFILAAIAELNGADRKWLNYAMAALLAMRIAHVELGLKGKDTLGPGRPIAFYGGQAWFAAVAAYGTYLVKGYWGY
ncbi:hypothetical protein MMC06_002236 [Schaereria dolodes]|nr:hypothetical protein [Schaereria dolodes]